MDKTAFLDRLDKVENLPTLPVVVRQIQSLIAAKNSNMSQIAAVITKDQAIASRVVRLINSAFYGLGGRVTSIQHAIVLLGLNTVKNLVTGVSVVKMFENQKGELLFDREKFWLHTFACALHARAIGREVKAPEPEDFFLSGLLHDIGILILEQFFHDEFLEVLRRETSEKRDYTDAEGIVLGTTHQEVGEAIARKWKIPLILTDAIRFHHDPGVANVSDPGSMLAVSVVHIADVMSSSRGFGMGNCRPAGDFSAAAIKSVGVPERRIAELFDAVEKEVRGVATEWGLK